MAKLVYLSVTAFILFAADGLFAQDFTIPQAEITTSRELPDTYYHFQTIRFAFEEHRESVSYTVKNIMKCAADTALSIKLHGNSLTLKTAIRCKN